jgi:hypothetical protein
VSTAPGRFRRALTRLTADPHDLAAAALQQESAAAGATAVTACAVGQPVCVAGTLRQVVLRPRAGVPTLEAEVYDGSGTVTLIWLGRRRIGGIEPGRSLVARGRLTIHEERPTIYNPSYELRPAGA